MHLPHALHIPLLLLLTPTSTSANQLVFPSPVQLPPPTLIQPTQKITLPSSRTVTLSIPPAYNATKKYPLVVSFHGAGGTSQKQQRITQLSRPELRIADSPFFVAYPQGVNNTDKKMRYIWDGAPYSNRTANDVGFVLEMLTYISSHYNIDASRIYACGKSNGGGFAMYLACRPDTSNLFAAYAPVAPALYQEGYAFHNCSPGRAVPILHTHGVRDVITPFYGDDPGWYGKEPDVRIWRKQWAMRNGCKEAHDGKLPQSIKHKIHTNTWEEIWNCSGAEVRALTVDDLGHAWPSIEGLDRIGAPNHTTDFDLTSQHLVQFFSRHKLQSKHTLARKPN